MTKNRLLLIAFATAALILPVCSGNTPPTKAPVVVVIDKGRSGFVYTVNSKVTKDILLTLTTMRAADSDPRPKSILLVHEDVTLTMLNGMRGVMSKAGYVFPDQRVFFFTRDNVKDRMYELKFSAPIPFSAGGDVADVPYFPTPE